LLEDEDLHKNINRQEFEDLIKPMIEEFKQLLIDTLEQSGKYYVTMRLLQEKS
jgi:molecular chaperone DnaK (HSP70)